MKEKAFALAQKAARSSPVSPTISDWRSSDEEEINRRILRAQEERPRIRNLTPAHPVFSNYAIHSTSGLSYEVEIRDIKERRFACSCADFRINGLGTCKHVEAVLLLLGTKKRFFKKAGEEGSDRIDIVLDRDAGKLRIERNENRLPQKLRALLTKDSSSIAEMREQIDQLKSCSVEGIRISLEIEPWLRRAELAEESRRLRREYELGVQSGVQPPHETLAPLFPYQREGMLHLAFKERALLADEMGLGKTIQAIAACALLHRIGKAKRVLVIAPASLKTEWEEQIKRFTPLDYRLLYGGRGARVAAYNVKNPPFFTIVNYEQVIPDSLDINERFRPDIIVLDEAQRIKNWSTKTAQAIKRLQSRYAFVLTGTPIENRIDELYSIVDFLNPEIFGALFRFNREFYTLNEKGRPESYQNLKKLRERVAPLLLRRRKVDVETELPDRTDRNLFVPLTPEMRMEYAGPEKTVAELMQISKRRPLTPKEQDLLMISLNMMRIICDSPSILKGNKCQDCPKLHELARVLEEVLADDDVKVIIFSEWEGMLKKVRAWAEAEKIGFAWHTGKVEQKRRRAEIMAFQKDPKCRLFLSTDSGGVGLNLQVASVVINCDLPWNPAKLEQRIARAWRKNQRRPVTVLNLISESTIEHGMLITLAQKMELAQGVLDGTGDLDKVQLRRGRDAFLKRLEQIMSSIGRDVENPAARRSSDPAIAFAEDVRGRIGAQLVHCDETWLHGSDTPVVLAVVQTHANEHRAWIEEAFAKMPWREHKPTLQVLDLATWELMQSLAASGLITIQARCARQLLPLAPIALPPSWTKAELERLRELKDLVGRKSRGAKALLAENLLDEAAGCLNSGLLAFAQVLAIQHHKKEPSSLDAANRAALLERSSANQQEIIGNFWQEPTVNSMQAIAKLLGEAQTLEG